MILSKLPRIRNLRRRFPAYSREWIYERGLPGVPFLVKALKCKKSYIREGAALLLGSYRRYVDYVVRDLVLLFMDKDWKVGYSAMNVLIKIGAPAVPELVDVLSSKEKTMRLMAVKTLGKIGRPAKDALNHLEEISKKEEEDNEIRDEARLAIKRIKKKK
jgi:HEAT repeat protein